MARIRKEDHPTILRMIEVEHRKVPEVAAEFGSTPANIYALVGKLRRQAAQAPLALDVDKAEPAPAGPIPAAPAPNVVAFERAEPPAPPAGADTKPVRQEIVPPPPSPRKGVGAKLAKPGYGLVMRTADGEETVAPFRSLDDLLSAIKPILRATAKSSEPVWFSLQTLDLAAIEMDAA
jgi:hypothetical protein